MFVLRWRFLGSDLDRPLFLSNMFCQFPSEISFIHSSSFTCWRLPPIHGVSLPPPLSFPRSQPSSSPCGPLAGSASPCPHHNTAGTFTAGKVALFPRKTSFFLFDYFFLDIPIFQLKITSLLFSFFSTIPPLSPVFSQSKREASRKK